MFSVKVVLDTNIWLSYIISGRFEELLLTIKENNIAVFISDDLINELKVNFKRDKIKKHLRHPSTNYLELIEQVTIPLSPLKKYSRLTDQNDNFLIDLMIASKAQLLVTGDKQVLKSRFKNFQIVSLKEFKSVF